MNLTVFQVGENVEVVFPKSETFNLADTLDCGQAFRWEMTADGAFHGVALGHYLKASQEGQKLILHNTNFEEFESVWRGYFDLDREYGYIKNIISENGTLKRAAEFAGGIRVLRQDPWECLCSFIISQNNNIPRIKGIINRLCETFGEPIGEGFYSFPSAERIAPLSLEDLAPLRSGFRAKYILDAARRVASGECDLEKIAKMKTEDARAELTKIYGVGEKVADCVLLFSMARVEVIPKDVWIKRVLSELFDGALPDFAAPYAGIAQQYLFHFARMTKLEIEEMKL